MLSRLESAGRWLEDAVLVTILTGMILLAFSQIILRNFFDIGVVWGDELLRLMVLWIAVAGAVAASRSDKHITISILDRFLPGRWGVLASLVVRLFTVVVCGVVAWYSFAFVKTSWEFEDTLLGNIPAWWLQSVLPLGFTLITYRYAVLSLQDVIKLFRRGERR